MGYKIMTLRDGHDIKIWSFTPHLILFITAPDVSQLSDTVCLLLVLTAGYDQ